MLKPVDSGMLNSRGWKTIAENNSGIAFRIRFQADVTLYVDPEDGMDDLLEIFNRFTVDGQEVITGLIEP